MFTDMITTYYTHRKANPNIEVGPSADFIIREMVRDWCGTNPMPEVIDENDSWHWTIAEMHNILKQLTK